MKLILLALSLTLTAQVTPSQLRAPVTPAVQLLAFKDGKPVLIFIGDGVEIKTAADGSVSITAKATAAASKCVTVTRNADGSYATTSAGIITRNGLVQNPAKDYRIVLGSLQTISTWGADDVVLACGPG